MLAWDEVRQDFEPDGALRDIYVLAADSAAWDRALAFLLSEGTARYTVDGVALPLPKTAKEALSLRPDSSPLLHVERDGIEYACHFFTADEIELDFLPAHVAGPGPFEGLLRFIVGLGRSTGRDVLVTHENYLEAPILRYVAATGDVEHASPIGRRTGGSS
ncbi:MAG: hypothetical protein ACREKR_02175 [Candidatus Methylomirabilales bacterium]